MGVCAVVGGQYGSEGKGAVIARIAEEYQHHVRVGAANAGHTLYTRDQDSGSWGKHVMQQLPCAAYANPDARLYIGPGALISPGILDREIGLLAEWRGAHGLELPPVVVDRRAHVITQAHIDREQATDLAKRIGSTSTIAKEGVGAAQAARVMRESGCVLAQDWYEGDALVELADVPRELWYARANGDSVLLEGTQGTGLSLTTGAFPYVTSRNTTAAGLAADCGVAPNRLDRVVLVLRTYPIRVAGMSGDFYHDGSETSWEKLGVDPETERTTVTKKVRRVASFSYEQALEACYLNGATEVALMFADYIQPELGSSGSAHKPLRDMIANIEGYTGVPVTMLGTGPHSIMELKESAHGVR